MSPATRRLLTLAVGMKILVIALGHLAGEMVLDRPMRDAAAFRELWFRWDARHYVGIAEEGYAGPAAPIRLVFLPLFPALIRSASVIGGAEVAAFGLATLFSLLLPFLIYLLARMDFDGETSERAVLLLLVFPTAFFLHVPYTEALFMALCAGTWIAARQDRFGAAALLATLAGLTRINGAFLFIVLVLEALEHDDAGEARRLLWSAVSLAGPAIYLALNLQVAGSPFAFLDSQSRYFSREFASPLEGLVNTLAIARSGAAFSAIQGVTQVALVAFPVAACVLGVQRLRPSYLAWMIANVLLMAAQAFWVSNGRYVLACFPAFFIAAARLRGPTSLALWTAGSSLWLGVLLTIYASGNFIA